MPGLGARLAAGFDRAFAAAFLRRSARARSRSRAESLGPEERERALRAIVALYDRPEHFADDRGVFFGTVPRIAPRETQVRALPGGGRVVDVSWPSGYTCFGDAVRDRYDAATANARAHARLTLHDDGRAHPAVLLIHGYLGGAHALEARAWPIEWLHRRGFDVALWVLPFHGLRSGGGAARRPLWPSSDPRINVEGFRQAMHDLRALRAWLVARGAPAVGAMGMSLGGYTAALLATVDRDLAFAVPFIPLASIADFARDGGRLVGTEDQRRIQHELLEDSVRVVSPLARAPLVPRDRILVVGGEADRITPLSHARRLAEHFGSELVVFRGGHLLQLGRSDAFRAVGRMLGRAGLIGSPGAPRAPECE